MILQEAILSGKPFRREINTNNHWLIIDKCGYIIFEITNGGATYLREKDILAMDWIIKEETPVPQI